MFFARRYFFLLLLVLLSLTALGAQAVTPQIAAGYYHGAALKSDGTVWAWGYNGFGQLGNGSLDDSGTPVQVQGIGGVSAIAAGFFHTVALKSDGTVWLWGDNSYDQLGAGSLAYSSVPLQVAGLANVVAVAAAGAHTMALKSDGTVWVWGWNAYGQLGIGSTLNAQTPVQVPGLQNIRAVAAGFFHSLALRPDGTLSAWGYNGHGQLGDGSTVQANVPVAVRGIDGVTSMAAGGGHSVALKNDGMVWAWGWNNFGQLGDGSTVNSSLPLQVGGLGAVKSIAAGFFHSMALQKSDGTLRAWGYNAYGQLGNGSTADSAIPVAVANLNAVAAISSNNNHAAALKIDGSIWTWGDNAYGQLGNGSQAGAVTPVRVLGAAGLGLLNLGKSSYQDMWSQPDAPGWGVNITQHDATLFATWYTYDASGTPLWLVLPGGVWTDGTTYSGTLYGVSGSGSGLSFTPGKVEATPVGMAEFHFTDADHARLNYSYQGSTGVKQLSRYVFDDSGNVAGGNRSDMWWSPSEPGWGLSITQQFQTIFASWYTYDAAGKATWYVLPGGHWIDANTYGGTLYRTSSSASGAALSPGSVNVIDAGSATLVFTDADNAELHYEVDGVAGSKTISRLPF